MAYDMALNKTRGDGQVVELRGNCPRQTIDVLDAVAIARDISRMALVEEILGSWADKVVHESTLVVRVLRGNGTATDANDRRAE